jgi:hypothetical protein
VNAGLDSAQKMLNILDTLEDRPAKQRLRELQVAKGEREEAEATANTQWEKDRRDHVRKEWGDSDQIKFDTKQARLFQSARDGLASGRDLTEEEEGAYLMATHQAVDWKNKTPEEIDKFHKDIKALHDDIAKYTPSIMNAMEKGGKIERTQAPDLFNKFDAVYDVTKGPNDKEKSLNAVYFQGGKMVPVYEKVDQDGNKTYGPAIVGNPKDPNAVVMSMPVQMLMSDLQHKKELAEGYDQLRMKYGDDELAKKREKARESLKESESFRAGELAVQEYITKKGKNYTHNVNELRNAYTTAAREKAKELGIPLDQKKLSEGAKEYLPEKQSKSDTEWDVRRKAAEGDPESKKMLEGKHKEKMAEKKNKDKDEGDTTEKRGNREDKAKKAFVDKYATLGEKTPKEAIAALPEDQRPRAQHVYNLMNTYLEKDPKLTWNEALELAEKYVPKLKQGE